MTRHLHFMNMCCTRREDLHFNLWSFCLGILLTLQAAAAQKGFISIDCGSTTSYTDARGIVWSTDEEYIATGINKDVAVPASLANLDYGRQQKQLSTARSFQASRNRHCYVFPNVKLNETYLIRPSFLFGNLAASLPSGYAFGLAIDSAVVDTIQISDNEVNTLVSHEYYVASRSEEIVLCLLPIKGDPFISSLELRHIEYISFAKYMYDNQYGMLARRLNCGANDTDPSIRYPDDKFDRIWETPGSDYAISSVWADKTLQDVRNASSYDNNFFAPPPVMASAWSDESIQFSVSILGGRSLWICFQLGEVEVLSKEQQRVQNIFVNGYLALWSNNFTFPHNSTQWAIFGDENSPAGKTQLSFAIRSYPNTTLPPVVNGLEIHMISPVVTNVVDSSDRKALDAIRQILKLMDWTGDPCFPVPWSWLECNIAEPARVTAIKLSNYELNGTIPEEIAELSALEDLWLDGNFFTGSIPNFSGLNELQTLHLQSNLLSGTIPADLADIPNLTELFLRGNNFTGAVPMALIQKAQSGLNLQIDGPSSPSTSPSEPGSKSRSKGTSIGVILGASVGVVPAIAVLVGAMMCCLRKKREKAAFDGEKGSHQQRGNYAAFGIEKREANDHGVQMTKPFSLAEVSKSTNNFERQIGEGGFGPIYLGTLDNGAKVAVKVNSESSAQGRTEFLTEVRLLSRTHHRNLVHLVGFCDENEKRILLYEFMEEGTLKDHLYGAGQTYALDWPTRLQIATDAARGLEYLHYDCHPRILHRDVKSSNILLNGDLQAKVADFGISKFYEEGISGHLSAITKTMSSKMKGTFGYLDPEYFSTTKFTCKSDVYSFGVILLEIMSGRAPIEATDAGQWILIDSAQRLIFESKLEMLVDKALGNDYNKESMWKVAELAMRCVEPQSINRPDMREVVTELCEASQYGAWMESMEIPGSETGSTTEIRKHGSFNSRGYQRSNFSTVPHDSDKEIRESTDATPWMPVPR